MVSLKVNFIGKKWSQIQFDIKLNNDKEPPSCNTILTILQNIWKVIEENTKEKYRHYYLGREDKNVAVGESLFVHDSKREQILVILKI